MKKVIKLTESDLEKIIKKILKEDPEPLPDMADVPLGKVEAVQQALVNAGYDVGPTGVDGIFGRNTKLAVIKYQKDNGIKQTGNVGPITGGKLGVQPLTSGRPQVKKPVSPKPTTPISNKKPTVTQPSKVGIKPQFQKFDNIVQKSDYLGKGGQFEKNLYGGRSKQDYLAIQRTIGKIPPSKKSSLPLHIRALMDYLAGRETPFTAADLTREEQDFLKKVAISNAKTGLNYPLWKKIGAGNLPTAMTSSGSKNEKEKLNKMGGGGSLTNPGLAGEFMYTLGQIDPPAIKVSPDKKNVTLNDKYDFNTEGKTKEDLLKSFAGAVGSWWTGDGTLYSAVRNAVAFRESGGYKGYPVNITV
jgi:peptidoglycan hydrolase-like protein with peptidoglycan-binding domain